MTPEVPQPSLIVVVNDGRTGADTDGHWDHEVVRWAGGWHNMLTKAELPGKVWDIYPTPRSVADLGAGLLVHNPWGRLKPMDLEARSKVTKLLDDQVEGTSCDTQELVCAASDFRKAGHWLEFYLGGEGVSTVLPDETPRKWANREQAELQPLLDIEPRINGLTFDWSFMQPVQAGTDWEVKGGRFGGWTILLKRIRRLGIPISVEPGRWATSDWFEPLGVLMRTTFYEQHKNNWFANNLDRVKQAFLPPKEMAWRYILVEKGLMTDAEHVDAVKSWRDAGWRPLVLLKDFREGML